MKLQIQTLTGETREVEAEPQNSILDLKVCRSLLVCLIIIHNKQDEVADPDFDWGDTEVEAEPQNTILDLKVVSNLLNQQI